nr:unnamed protein product [Callosobruchus analis]
MFIYLTKVAHMACYIYSIFIIIHKGWSIGHFGFNMYHVCTKEIIYIFVASSPASLTPIPSFLPTKIYLDILKLFPFNKKKQGGVKKTKILFAFKNTFIDKFI